MTARRELLVALGALALAPLGAEAQPTGAKRRIGWLTSATTEFARPFLPIIREHLRRVGYEEGRNLAIEWRYAEGKIDRLPELAEDLVRQNVELIVASGNDPCNAAMRATSALPIVLFAVALERKLPSVGTAEIFVTAGGMLYYGPDFLKIIERTMSYVDRILRGAKPGDLPIEQPTNFQFIVNTKTARALGLKIPQAVLLRADRVIE